VRWQFKEEPPLSVKIVLPLFMVAILLNIAMVWIIPERSPIVPDRVHTVPIRYKGGVTYFVRPSVAQGMHDLNWLAVGLGAATFLLFLLHRDKLERIS
jgi:hypothetical protein